MRSGFASKGIIRKLCLEFFDVAIVDKGLELVIVPTSDGCYEIK